MTSLGFPGGAGESPDNFRGAVPWAKHQPTERPWDSEDRSLNLQR